MSFLENQNSTKTTGMQIYKISGKVRVGPFTTDQVRSMINLQTMSGTDLIWHEGLLKPIQVSESEHFSTDVMMAEMEAAGREAGAELIKAVEDVTQEAQKHAVRSVWMRILAFAGHVGLIIGSYFISEWLRGRLQPDQVAGWYRGLIDGGYPALVHFAQGLVGVSKPVFWNGATSWGYTTFFWLGIVLTLINVISLPIRIFKAKL